MRDVCHYWAVDSTSRSTGWHRALMLVVLVVGLYAGGLVFAGLFFGDQIFGRLGFGPDDGEIVSASSRDYLRLIYGVLGAVIVGWMITIAAIVVGPMRRGESWALHAVVLALGVWFVLDTGISLALGFVGHALFNVAFAVALAAPLAGIGANARRPGP